MSKPTLRSLGLPPSRTNVRQAAYMQRLCLHYAHPCRELTETFMDQLDACADEEAQRLLLGVSGRKEEQ